MSKRKNLTYKCVQCDTLIMPKIGKCNGNVLLCAVCGSSHLLSFDGKVLKTAVRLTDMETVEELHITMSANS